MLPMQYFKSPSVPLITFLTTSIFNMSQWGERKGMLSG